MNRIGWQQARPLAAALTFILAAACGGPPAEEQSSGETRQASAAATALNPSDTYVNLFKWRWTDIATECTNFLGPQGFGAVQISPPAEHKNVNYWWNIYQPVNHHNLTSDMGTSAQLQAMITACHAAGVRVYADVVFNQMAADSGTGVGGSSYNAGTLTYPYFSSSDFHSQCSIDYSSASNTASCWLLGMPDLNTGSTYVQGQFETYLDTLIAMGVDGFRIDAAKHILPSELATILAASTTTTLLGENRFVTHEVIEDQSWIDLAAYQASGTVNEFRFTRAVRDAFRNNALGSITTYMGTGSGGGTYGLITDSSKATVFVNNHDTERSTGDSLNYTSDSGGKYDLANVYMLAQPYGKAQLQSGYAFSYGNTDENAPTASPYDSSGNPVITTTCSNTSAACGWDFVHRWSTIYPMVKFRSAASGTSMTVLSTGNGNQLAFRRGSVGFVALNNDSSASWTATFATGLAAGTYCNIVHGLLNSAGTACTSDSVTVDSSGNATITVAARGGSTLSAVAIYTGQKVSSTGTAPAAPTSVTATAASKTSVTVAWTASTGATSYAVYRSTSASGTFTSLGTTTGTSYSSTGLTAGTTYYYYVTASNSYGTSAASSTVSATTPLYSANYPAMYLRGSMNSWGATAMTLVADNTWSVTTTLTASTTYTYKYEIGGGTTWSTNWGFASSSTTSSSSGTASASGYNMYYATGTGTSYTFTFNDSTLAYTVTASGSTTAPAAPTGVSATASGLSITVAWTASSGATSYTVYRSTSASGTFSSVGTSTTTSFTNSSLSAGTTYYYYVTAANSAGTSSASSTASATTASSTVTTTINVHFDVGYGNSIYIRGSLSPLSWTTGVAATWTTGNVWVYSTTAIASGASFEFKALKNDSGWSDGSNFTGTGGATIDVYPTFNGNFYDTMDAIGTNWTVSGGTSTAKWVQGTLDGSGVARCTNCSTEAVLTKTTSMSKTGTVVTLGFKYSTTGLLSSEYLKVDVLKGSTWTTVGTYYGTAAATNKSIDITSYQSTAMKIRFRAKMSGSSKLVTVDNVTVSTR